MVIRTGNVGSKANVDLLQSVAIAGENGSAENLKIVAGDADTSFDFPESSVTSVGDFKIGVVHGHQIIPWGDQDTLVKYAGRLGVDILVSGHTHRHTIHEVT